MKTIRIEYNYTIVKSDKIFTILHIDKEKKFVVITYEDGKLERIGYVFLQNELESGKIILNKKCYSKRELIDSLLRCMEWVTNVSPYAFEWVTKIGLVRVYKDKKTIVYYPFVDSEYVEIEYELTQDEFNEFNNKTK